MPDITNPLIIQSDFSLLLEVCNDKFEIVRNKLTQFAELIKSPEYIHTYKISSLSIWNAASIGINITEICETLEKYSKYASGLGVPIPLSSKKQAFSKERLALDFLRNL